MLEIEEILKQHCEKYEVWSDEYEADSIEDFSLSDKKYLTYLYMHTEKPNIKLEFSREGVDINSYNATLSTAGIISKIEAIINKKRSYFRYIRQPNLMFIALISMFIVPPFIPKVDKISIILSLLFILSCIFLCIIGVSSISDNSTIYSIKKDNPSFLAQNKDKIILQIINSFISGVVGFILGILFSYFKLK